MDRDLFGSFFNRAAPAQYPEIKVHSRHDHIAPQDIGFVTRFGNLIVPADFSAQNDDDNPSPTRSPPHNTDPSDDSRYTAVCRGYLHVTKSHTIWFTYIQQHFIRRNLPLPGLDNRHLEVLSAGELEGLAIKAEKYRRNWSSTRPVPTRRSQFTAVPESRIISLKFLSRRGEHWLLSLSMTRNSGLRAFTFQCWDLGTSPPTCIARRILHHFGGLAYNKMLTGRAVVAVMTPECVGFFPSCCLAALTCRGVPLRICLIDIDPVTKIRNTSGGGDDGGGSGGRGVPSDMARRSPAQACVNVATLEDRATGNMVLIGDLVLTQDDVGRTFLYHFQAPQNRLKLVHSERSLQPERILDVLVDRDWIIIARTTAVEIYSLPPSINRSMEIEPIGVHKWQWKVDSISLARPVNSPNPTRIAPVHLVIRYGSIHPWPVNLIHRFVLNINDAFDPSHGASRLNFPYVLPPLNTQMIGSPIRLMSTYDMAVGSHGTIIYTDSHTETYFNQSDFGQRLAGTRIDEQPGDGTEGPIGTMVGESSVYEITERDEWTRIALQEEEGRIAIGHVDGRITVLDYA
ncbi:hypothetical protein NP233_g10099 [Leucocoprinus birnbaumii]|uniref:Uncharacterized protein n=1 Tax=Leucocoprinus birnbaumii TaxID=56174 RepID=A0AAD5VML9_9AGAR|nr:hypothetical protein NP233_g10099 [Leucocoprinus birnbaumii]